ncbi:hypothetical protein LEP1GSC007_4348 [Leptospira interrogans serovar Bulgarica str. Mallika]|nr:hypothetical protein LEP1GSC007_4348 [Leptospira interrogans serovar Bulgarica str. Mallika]
MARISVIAVTCNLEKLNTFSLNSSLGVSAAWIEVIKRNEIKNVKK